MTRFRVPLAVLILQVAIALPSSASDAWPERPSVVASGSAQVRVAPDRIEIAVGVETRDVNLAASKAANDAAIARIVETAKQHNIAPAKIQTDYLSIEPNYEDRPTRLSHYSVRRSVVITSDNIGGFEKLIAALIEAGANHVHDIRFMTSQLRAHRDEARKLATQAALEKARLLAESLGRKVGKARVITESYDWGSSYGSWWRGRAYANYQNVSHASGPATADSGEGTLAPGRISVTATVNVTFDLE